MILMFMVVLGEGFAFRSEEGGFGVGVGSVFDCLSGTQNCAFQILGPQCSAGVLGRNCLQLARTSIWKLECASAKRLLRAKGVLHNGKRVREVGQTDAFRRRPVSRRELNESESACLRRERIYIIFPQATLF